MTASADPRRGDIWLTSLGASRRGEPGRNRPAVIVSADELLSGESHELIVVVPLSSSLAPSQLRPQLKPQAGIDKPSAAISGAVRGVSRQRLLRRLGAVDSATLAEIERALALVLGFA